MRRPARTAKGEAKVTQMLHEDTDVSDSDQQTIVNYLAKNFPPLKVEGLELKPAEAEAIVHYREQNGNFKTLEDFRKVSGVDTVKIESKRELLEF